MLLECLLSCLLFNLFRKTNLHFGKKKHQNQPILKAYAVTSTLNDVRQYISMIHFLKTCDAILGSGQSLVLPKPPWHCKISKENP